MFLPLAERMVEKMVKEEKIEAEAEVSMVWSSESSALFEADQSSSGVKVPLKTSVNHSGL